MNSRDDTAFRLSLARGYLREAEEDANAKKWYRVLADAQEATENAGKSILLHFHPISYSHDLDKDLMALVGEKRIPPSIREQIEINLDAFRGMGSQTHKRASYGDEQAFIPPWDLITEGEALIGLTQARRAVALAQEIFDAINKAPK